MEFEDWFGLVASVQVLVLTHNFSVWKPAKKRLEVKKIVGCGFIEGR